MTRTIDWKDFPLANVELAYYESPWQIRARLESWMMGEAARGRSPTPMTRTFKLCIDSKGADNLKRLLDGFGSRCMQRNFEELKIVPPHPIMPSDFRNDDDDECPCCDETRGTNPAFDGLSGYYVNDGGVMYVDVTFLEQTKKFVHVAITYCSVDQDKLAALDTFTRANACMDVPKAKKPNNKGYVYVLQTTRQGIVPHRLGYAATPFPRGNYTEAVCKGMDDLLAELRTPNPSGRLALFNGVPGGGKTYLIRSIVHEVPEALVIFIPPDFIEQLGDPDVVHALLGLKRNNNDPDTHQPLVLIAEDADVALRADTRKKNMKLLQSILNLTSGVMADLLDIRLIATTNSQTKDGEGRFLIDSALLRDGRLSVHIEVDKLSKKQAQEVYSGLVPGGKYTGKPVLASIYRAAHKAGWRPGKKVKEVQPNAVP